MQTASLDHASRRTTTGIEAGRIFSTCTAMFVTLAAVILFSQVALAAGKFRPHSIRADKAEVIAGPAERRQHRTQLVGVYAAKRETQ